jgi:hypothetical protein
MNWVGSIHFSLFCAFGNNAFSSSVFLARGNPIFGQPNSMQGFIPLQGEMTRIYSSRVLGNNRKGCISITTEFDCGKPLPHSVEPWKGFNTYAKRFHWGNTQPRSLEYFSGRNPYTRHVIQLRDSANDAESNTRSFYWTGHHGFYQNTS